ncbi:hypothetical protein [Goodfellowiella coeruleoviolacea]|uniref:Uncharacterized protein n=1 Tax=Goodfellowiella coeruleoviolacea TaxID=334858 RepID=A0AAE3GA41_9PSEU|nr:hypothetical protein [Goodfellowiella coeruleoviolacea]MCP2164477.1 hypothetical protein [Goodfellowiella coeruleoviolacea]
MRDVKAEQLVLTLAVEWYEGPFWVLGGGDEVSGPYDTEDIRDFVALSPELLAEIGEWNEFYQATYNDDDPANSGITEPAEARKFDERGRVLAHKLRAEIPDVIKVRYQPVSGPLETIVN